MDLKTQVKVESFSKLIGNKYLTYCKNKDLEPDLEGLVAYLMQRNIIRETTRKRYLVLDFYPRQMWLANGNKSRAVEAIAEALEICERTVYYILKDHQGAFKNK